MSSIGRPMDKPILFSSIGIGDWQYFLKIIAYNPIAFMVYT